MNNIKDYENLSSKRVLLRLDLNVPLKNGDIIDETRIIKIIRKTLYCVRLKTQVQDLYHKKLTHNVPVNTENLQHGIYNP